MKKIFEAVKKFVGLGIFLISLLLISSYIYAVYPANNLALNNNLMKDISPHINEAYANVPIGDLGGGGGIPIHYTVSTFKVNGTYGTISPGYISSIAPNGEYMVLWRFLEYKSFSLHRLIFNAKVLIFSTSPAINYIHLKLVTAILFIQSYFNVHSLM